MEEPLRYAWIVEPYKKDEPQFTLALHVMPVRVLGDGETYRDFPEITEVINSQIINGTNITENEDSSSMKIVFDKSATDKTIADTITNATSILEDAGVTFTGVILLYKGFPDLTYGQAYLEHTTSVEELTIMELVKLMSNNNTFTIERLAAETPLSSNQKFDPALDTDLNYVDDIIAGEINKINERLERSNKCLDALIDCLHKSQAVIQAFEQEAVRRSTETYSSENSSEYSDFQSNWI